MPQDAKQVILSVSKVKAFLQCYHEATQPSPSEGPSTDPSGPPLLRQHSSRSLGRDRSGSVRSLRSASSGSINVADERADMPTPPPLLQQGSGGLGSERGSGRSLRTQRSLSRGRLPPESGQKQVGVTQSHS